AVYPRHRPMSVIQNLFELLLSVILICNIRILLSLRACRFGSPRHDRQRVHPSLMSQIALGSYDQNLDDHPHSGKGATRLEESHALLSSTSAGGIHYPVVRITVRGSNADRSRCRVSVDHERRTSLCSASITILRMSLMRVRCPSPFDFSHSS